MPRTSRSSFEQIRDLGFVAIFVAATSSLGNPAAGQNQAPTLDRPPAPTVGDTRTYKWDGQIVVSTYIGQKDGLNCYFEKAADGRQSEECRTWDDNLVRRVGTWEPLEVNPSSGRLSFPLFVGKQWDASYTMPNSTYLDANGHRFPGRVIHAQIVSYEKVTVPAGTFDAFKIIAYEITMAGRGWGWYSHGGSDIIEYYAPKLGMIKDDERYRWGAVSHSIGDGYYPVIELVSVNPAKPGS
jgi:hypothetical protein